MDDQKKYARLFNDIDSQALITVGLVLLSAIVLIIVSQRGLNWLASRLHGRSPLSNICISAANAPVCADHCAGDCHADYYRAVITQHGNAAG